MKPKKRKLISTEGLSEILAKKIILNKAIEKFNRIDQPILGGFRSRPSPCHNAPIILTEGGLRREICSKCHKAIREIRYK